jgi:SRP40, C-terminal domain
MDMVFNFTYEYGYSRAGHHIRIETQKREQTGGYTKPCSWTKASFKYPKLVDIFNEWQERHPETQWLPQEEYEAKKAMGATLKENEEHNKTNVSELDTNSSYKQKVQDKEDEVMFSSSSEDEVMFSSSSEDADDSSSTSDAESDTELAGLTTNAAAEAAGFSNLMPEDVPLPDSSVESGSESESDSSSESSSSSSDSESEEESNIKRAITQPDVNGHTLPNKVPTPSVASKKAVVEPSSESESESDSSSDESETQDIGEKRTAAATSRKRKAPESSSDSSSSSVSDSSTDTDTDTDSDSDGERATKKPKLASILQSQPTTATSSSATAHNSTSATSPAALPAAKDPSTRSESSATLARTSPDDRADALAAAAAVAGAVAAVSSGSGSGSGSGRFRRVPTDQAVDPRLASNAFAGGDYAQRAFRDLAPTRGRRFTREKGKKKRGSYRGGAIDAHGVNSIKFDD